MILLTITESENQLISGIPEYVTVESSVPANIFYTLDGSEPNEDSDIYIDKIYLTYSTPSVILKVKAVGAFEESDVVEESWTTTVPDIGRTALVGKEGINILPAGEEIVDSLAEDQDGDRQRSTVIEFVDLDIKTNTTDSIGQDIPGDSTIDFIKFPKVNTVEEVKISSTDSINFDPNAKVIIVDGYAGFDDQKVRVINRPHGTMRPVSKFYDEKVHYDNMVSGDFARYMYNPKTKKLVIYYRESLDGRWIISSQKVDAKSFNLTPSGNPFVFKWIIDRAQTKIF